MPAIVSASNSQSYEHNYCAENGSLIIVGTVQILSEIRPL